MISDKLKTPNFIYNSTGKILGLTSSRRKKHNPMKVIIKPIITTIIPDNKWIVFLNSLSINPCGESEGFPAGGKTRVRRKRGGKLQFRQPAKSTGQGNRERGGVACLIFSQDAYYVLVIFSPVVSQVNIFSPSSNPGLSGRDFKMDALQSIVFLIICIIGLIYSLRQFFIGLSLPVLIDFKDFNNNSKNCDNNQVNNNFQSKKMEGFLI